MPRGVYDRKTSKPRPKKAKKESTKVISFDDIPDRPRKVSRGKKRSNSNVASFVFEVKAKQTKDQLVLEAIKAILKLAEL